MSGNSIFVDTNIILYFLNGNTEVVEMLTGKDIVVSAITELELLSFSQITPDSESVIRNFLKDCIISELNPEIKELTIQIRRKSKLKLPDAIIAASAFYFKLPLLTADDHFKRLEEVEVVFYEM